MFSLVNTDTAQVGVSGGITWTELTEGTEGTEGTDGADVGESWWWSGAYKDYATGDTPTVTADAGTTVDNVMIIAEWGPA